MILKEVNYDISSIVQEISKIFNINNKETFCLGIDYNKVEPLILEKFLDDGDFYPDWIIFLIKIATKIIKDNNPAENIILQLDNSLIHKIQNIKFKTLSLRLDDFIDICLKYIDYELGFFIVWGLEEYTSSKIIKFKGLITPFADGHSIICLADKNDPILEYLKRSIE